MDSNDIFLHSDLINPIVVRHIPIPVTFGQFCMGAATQPSRESKIIVDPTSAEEAILAGFFTIILSSNGKVYIF